MAMHYLKDHLAFLYVHDKEDIVVFTSMHATQHCPIPQGTFKFQELLAPGQEDTVTFHKDQTRTSCVTSINKYQVMFRGVNQPTWEGTVYEKSMGDESSGERGIWGIVTVGNPGADAMEYLATILLEKTRASIKHAFLAVDSGPKIEHVVTKVVDVFEKHLLHFPKHDQWFTSGGKANFMAQVKYYVERNIPVEFILPSFPFKSCNPAKVMGKLPDKGEELALHSMKKVADLIQQVYPPGAHYNIVSDGHVFSDLCGIDDATVDMYGLVLREMAAELYPDLISFYKLDDFIMPQQGDAVDAVLVELIEGREVDHPVKTNLTLGAETARRILLSLFGTEVSKIRNDIDNDPETRSLYRGFSRFMYEDLAQHECCTKLPSRKSREKLCRNVGFSMILRNRAYSTLVEWVFPLQIRLSIHPHPNKDPKYGINLIHSSFISVQRSSSEQIFHIPTPWHNAVLEKADGKYMLAHFKTIRDGGHVTKVEELKVADNLVKQEGYETVLVYYPKGRPSHFKHVPCKNSRL